MNESGISGKSKTAPRINLCMRSTVVPSSAKTGADFLIERKPNDFRANLMMFCYQQHDSSHVLVDTAERHRWHDVVATTNKTAKVGGLARRKTKMALPSVGNGVDVDMTLSPNSVYTRCEAS